MLILGTEGVGRAIPQGEGKEGQVPTWAICAARRTNPEFRFCLAQFMNPCT